MKRIFHFQRKSLDFLKNPAKLHAPTPQVSYDTGLCRALQTCCHTPLTRTGRATKILTLCKFCACPAVTGAMPWLAEVCFSHWTKTMSFYLSHQELRLCWQGKQAALKVRIQGPAWDNLQSKSCRWPATTGNKPTNHRYYEIQLTLDVFKKDCKWTAHLK